jgi:hypothetical protein
MDSQASSRCHLSRNSLVDRAERRLALARFMVPITVAADSAALAVAVLIAIVRGQGDGARRSRYSWRRWARLIASSSRLGHDAGHLPTASGPRGSDVAFCAAPAGRAMIAHPVCFSARHEVERRSMTGRVQQRLAVSRAIAVLGV